MIRLQDIADMTGVSRTTVSNVLHGKTKRVSPETMDKIRKALEENSYEPNIGSVMLTGKGSKIIGFVLGYEYVHGYPATMDSFIGELLAAVQSEAQKLGYYVMIIGGNHEKSVVEMASRWNIEGLIFIGYSEERYRKLCRKLNKKAVLVDTYSENEDCDFQNVGIDDFDGGYQAGKYLLECGYPDAVFLAEKTRIRADENEIIDANDAGWCNEKRWQGFRKAMSRAGYCSKRRFVILNQDITIRKKEYEALIPTLLKVGAAAVAADYNAIELINFLYDHNIKVPEQVSIVGFDDCIYAEYLRPRLTTIHQNVTEKGKTALRRLVRLIEGEILPETVVSSPVKLVIRDSVKVNRNHRG